MKSIFWIILFTVLTYIPTFANKQLPVSSEALVKQVVTPTTKIESRTTLFTEWVRQDNVPNRINFPTRTGFALLRKEEIILLQLDSKTNDLWVHFRKNGQVKRLACPISLTRAMEKLKDFPFLKVSRSTIVNINEVVEYEGTRRAANLIMSDEATIKVSRGMAGLLHDWIQRETV